MTMSTMMACYKTPEFPIEPTVKFERFDKPNEVYTLNIGEGGNLVLSFTDGDGDLGKLNNADSTSFVVYRNLRDTAAFGNRNYVIPIIPKKGTTNAISGTIEIKLNDGLFNSYETYFLAKGISIDTFTYELYLTDRANHKSNVITTPPIVVKL
jgi:hypothetical protein